MDDPAKTIDALTLLDEARAGRTRSRVTKTRGGNPNNNEGCSAESTNIPQLTDRIGLRVDGNMVGSVPCTDTILTDRKDLATLEDDCDVLVVTAGLLRVSCGMGKDIGIEGPCDPGGERVQISSGHCATWEGRGATRQGSSFIGCGNV